MLGRKNKQSNQTNQSNQSNLCNTCHARPKYVENGYQHPYCGRTCAGKNSTNLLTTTAGNCVFCHVQPQFVDGTKTHPFCSKTCARKSKSSSTVPNPGSLSPSVSQSVRQNECLMCRKVPKQGPHNYCGKTCADNALGQAPLLLEVPKGHTTFTSVEDQFRVSWRHSTNCPTVKAIYKIVGSRASMMSYDAYRKAVETRENFAARGRSAGNENRRWHGTTRTCRLGDNGQTTFCSSTACSLCSIIKTSFDLNAFGKKTSWGRFGRGIYTSSTSSKSNDYSSNQQQSPWKAMLLNRVVVGKGHKLLQDNTSLTAPPAGFDSVRSLKYSSYFV
jgi:hypothetical protein